jgi:hypothetical protein
MLKVELAHIVIPLLLITTPIVADVNSEMARCQLEAEHLYPIPPNKGGQNWPDRAANLQKRAEGYRNVHAGGWLPRHCRMFCPPEDLRTTAPLTAKDSNLLHYVLRIQTTANIVLRARPGYRPESAF